MDNMQWTILRPATQVWANKWISVLEISVRLPTGVETEFYTVDAPDGVAILAVDDEHRAVLNRQFRPALGEVILELPCGQSEDGESRDKTALRELAEESGLYARDLQYLGSFYRNPGRDTGSIHAYFARVAGTTRPHQEQYECLETVRIPLNDLISQVLTNEIHDVTTIYAVLMLQSQLLQGKIKL